MKDNSLPKDREASPLPSSAKVSNKNNSRYQGGIPEKTPESVSTVASIKQRDQRGDAVPTTAAPEVASVTTPLNPPSMDEMKKTIKAKIREACEKLQGTTDGSAAPAIDQQLRNVSWWLDDEGGRCISRVIMNFSSDFSTTVMLEIFEKQLSAWIGKANALAWLSLSFRVENLISEWKDALLAHRAIEKSLDELRQFKEFPYNEELDRDLLLRAQRTFPDVDILGETNKKIVWWKDNLHTLKPIYKSARIQLWEFYQGQDKWLRNQIEKG